MVFAIAFLCAMNPSNAFNLIADGQQPITDYACRGLYSIQINRAPAQHKGKIADRGKSG